MKKLTHRLLMIVTVILLSHACVFSSLPGTSGLVSLYYLKIKGSTNINKFDFSYSNHQSEAQRIFEPVLRDDKIVELRIPVCYLETDNKLMQKDFYDLLEADKHPYIKIQIEEQKVLRALESSTQRLEFRVTLAGVTKYLTFDLTSIRTGENTWFLESKKSVMLKQFDLQPPKKLGGLVRVDQKVIVNFGMFFDLNNLIANK
jgi:hypothetical protein